MEDFLEEKDDIFVWIETVKGNKINTCVSGWNIDDSNLKDHLKSIKKSRGCNGSIKELTGDTGKIKVLQLQGNQKDYVIEYIKGTGIDESSIKIRL
jgi:translation initiation factor 1 (eIF-1/SUI1)